MRMYTGHWSTISTISGRGSNGITLIWLLYFFFFFFATVTFFHHAVANASIPTNHPSDGTSFLDDDDIAATDDHDGIDDGIDRYVLTPSNHSLNIIPCGRVWIVDELPCYDITYVLRMVTDVTTAIYRRSTTIDITVKYGYYTNLAPWLASMVLQPSTIIIHGERDAFTGQLPIVDLRPLEHMGNVMNSLVFRGPYNLTIIDVIIRGSSKGGQLSLVVPPSYYEMQPFPVPMATTSLTLRRVIMRDHSMADIKGGIMLHTENVQRVVIDRCQLIFAAMSSATILNYVTSIIIIRNTMNDTFTHDRSILTHVTILWTQRMAYQKRCQ
jgi:hypothetical protein